MAYNYPTQFDNGSFLLLLLGQFWSDLHEDPVVRSYAKASGKFGLQAVDDYKELVNCAGRTTIPVFHTERLYPLTIKQSDKEAGSMINSVVWDAPEGLSEVQVITDKPANPLVGLINQIDFVLDNGQITFVADPFINGAIEQEALFDSGGTEIDQQVTLWLNKAKFDQDLLSEQFGYAVDFLLDASETAKSLLVEYFNAIVSGTAKEQVQKLMVGLTGIPLAETNGEIVELVTADSQHKLVATDQKLYKLPLDSTVLVAVDDVLSAGQALCDALRFYDINRGVLPPASEVPELTLGPELTDITIGGPITFENTDLPVLVSTDGGFTRIDLALGGAALDVDAFWDLIHARGIANPPTLAQLLDTRTIQVGEPQAANLPATLNPLGILLDWVLRYNAYLCTVKSYLFPTTAPGISAGTFLRRVIPPHQILLILDETSPGTFTTTNASSI